MISADERSLLAQLAETRQKLGALSRDLRAAESELAGLAVEREHHRLLDQACAALEQLGEQGAAGLFWGERLPGGQIDAHLRGVRERVGAFQARLSALEARRQELALAIRREQEDCELLEDDVLELQRREEQRKLEWVVERELAVLPARALVMPWTRGGEDDERFRKSLSASLLASLALGALLPQIDLPLPERWEVLEVPDRLVRLIREERPLPPPPVRIETRPEQLEPEPPKEVVAEEAKPTPTPQQIEKPGAASKGILAFREKFSGLAESMSSARLGSQARIRSSGEGESGRPERSMVTTQAPGSSGGINLAALSRDVGGGGDGDFEGVQVTRATSTIGGGGGQDRPRSGGPSMSRTDEEIQIVFDRHKAALYRLYNRELRRDPTLKGQMVLRMTIEPDGSVSLCALQSTDMHAPQLAAQVVERVRSFDFGAKDGIPPITILYPIDFLPAT